jgi:hypothetical protein
MIWLQSLHHRDPQLQDVPEQLARNWRITFEFLPRNQSWIHMMENGGQHLLRKTSYTNTVFVPMLLYEKLELFLA